MSRSGLYAPGCFVADGVQFHSQLCHIAILRNAIVELGFNIILSCVIELEKSYEKTYLITYKSLVKPPTSTENDLLVLIIARNPKPDTKANPNCKSGNKRHR